MNQLLVVCPTITFAVRLVWRLGNDIVRRASICIILMGIHKKESVMAFVISRCILIRRSAYVIRRRYVCWECAYMWRIFYTSINIYLQTVVLYPEGVTTANATSNISWSVIDNAIYIFWTGYLHFRDIRVYCFSKSVTWYSFSIKLQIRRLRFYESGYG